jgi:16S rRNA C967 or C1407 C5-methylase (RsmB/RsmF family)
MKIPQEFADRMRDQLGAEAEEFFNALLQPSPTSIRLHYQKGRSSFQDLLPVPWCENGFYLPLRPAFQRDPNWHGGAYYVQEASSMILDDILRQLNLDSKPRIWLDLCAAPGGKTGILAKHLHPGDILIANEVVQQRKTILWENLVKGGYLNTIITNEPSSSFSSPLADIILLDAPCAGEGMMRKEPEAIHQWSPGLVDSCALLQKEIGHHAIQALKPGGILIYCTCSYSNQENIFNVLHFNETYGLASVEFNFPDDWNVVKLKHKNATGYQLYPHKLKGEGLFISVLRKRPDDEEKNISLKNKSTEFVAVPLPFFSFINHPDSFKVRKNNIHHSVIPAQAEEKANEVIRRFPRAEIIANLGEIKGGDVVPSHFLAMSGIRHAEIAEINLELPEALSYLERMTNFTFPEKRNGWQLVKFKNTTLGWIKSTSQGIKNHYPMNWRLRSRN